MTSMLRTRKLELRHSGHSIRIQTQRDPKRGPQKQINFFCARPERVLILPFAQVYFCERLLVYYGEKNHERNL